MKIRTALKGTGAAVLSLGVLAGCAGDDGPEGEYLMQEDLEEYYTEEDLQIWAEDQGYIAEEDLDEWVEEEGLISADDLDQWATENGILE
ncbi:hypothetical protein [Indiicoccus explosivorum]|uniref:hypothetical protein n=1 Tax=Indiicoccus explosivorum TaxID=1917864 RepID=UPI000B43C235|nr:hypothetical protein [Indiicoccus explosivorum]